MAPYRPRLTCNTKVFHDLPAKDAGKGTAKFRCCRCWLAFHSATVAERGHALYRDDQDDAGSGAVQ